MSLLGKAALAMWWDMAPGMRPDFEHWHSHEHFPERLGIPGFQRASRWRSSEGEGEGFFVLYELEDTATLASGAYLARLNSPTPWSTRLMPHHRHMVRSQCRVLASVGGMIGGHALTLRITPAVPPAQADRTEAALRGLQVAMQSWALAPGVVGAHLLRHEPPPIGPTTEQRIRGLGDQAASWVLVACGYEAAALSALLDDKALQEALALAGPAQTVHGAYALCYSAVPADVAGISL